MDSCPIVYTRVELTEYLITMISGLIVKVIDFIIWVECKACQDGHWKQSIRANHSGKPDDVFSKSSLDNSFRHLKDELRDDILDTHFRGHFRYSPSKVLEV